MSNAVEATEALAELFYAAQALIAELEEELVTSRIVAFNEHDSKTNFKVREWSAYRASNETKRKIEFLEQAVAAAHKLISEDNSPMGETYLKKAMSLIRLDGAA